MSWRIELDFGDNNANAATTMSGEEEVKRKARAPVEAIEDAREARRRGGEGIYS